MAEALDDAEWLARQFEDLTVELDLVTPSQWAEEQRYLPPSVTSLPGYYSFDVAPYVREILDCLSIDSPVREVAVQKGAQILMTTGVIENGIGYYIAHVKTSPVMMVTADAELAKLRLETNIKPMLQHSGLMDLIKSADEGNRRKRGLTDKKIEWLGGGFLVPFGAQNANKLRSLSVQVLLRDEIDGWPTTVGKDGDPIQLSEARTAAYESSRKIVDLSTPLIRGQSKIATRYALGDQRKYFVCCLACGFAQVLRWRHTNPETGEVTGIVWETEGGRLVPGSVRYRCQNCGHAHTNDDKTKLLSPEFGAEWRPTAEPSTPYRRSYHLSALYSPVGMQTWESCVQRWLEAWDEEKNRPRDMGKLQVFYNNVLGEPFEVRGERVRFERVSSHRRREYSYGQIPNHFALERCASRILLLTCAVDVQKEYLAVAVFGWARGRRAFLIDYWDFEGDTEQLDDRGSWSRLRELIEQRVYTADDGAQYRIQLTLIDSSYRADTVYRFCASYAGGVYPIKGREAPAKNVTLQAFQPFTNRTGRTSYSITVDLYKDRWSAALRHSWDPSQQQPHGHFNAPLDATDQQLKELTVEVKREKIEPRTGKRLGFEWHRPSGAANELWDLLIYNNAALDLLAWDLCRNQLGLDFVNMQAFEDLCVDRALYFKPP